MRVLAIGDIHGCSGALRALLEAVAPTPDDRLVALGDYVDRGPDTPGVLDMLIALHATGRLVALRGNHDQMMTDARHNVLGRRSWYNCGGRETVEAYGAAVPEAFDPADVPAAHWDFLENKLVDAHETATHIFVHANLDPDLDLADQPDYLLRWEKLEPDHARPHASGKTVVCGHTRQKGGVPLDLGHTVCIDTDVYGAGWLTCLDVGSGKYWQADRDGRVRTGWLGAAP